MTTFLLIFLTTFAHANPPLSEMAEGATVDVAPTHVFIPQGFDNNDLNVQIVLDGELPSLCYSIKNITKPEIDTAHRKIFIRQTAFLDSGNAWCDNDVPRSFTRVVDLEQITQAGLYEVLVMNPATSRYMPMGTLPIAATKSRNRDDYLYLPVKDGHFVKQRNYATDVKVPPVIVIEGIFRNSCMHYKDVKINVRSNHVIEVLPIAELAKEKICGQVHMPFETRVTLPRVPKGRYLIHIRSHDSDSVNKVMDL